MGQYSSTGLRTGANCHYSIVYEPMLSQLTAATLGKDAKTMLQEVLQSKHLGLPSYEVVDVKGAAHEQEFVVEAVISKLGVVTTGVGRSRRQAEQEAAQKAPNDRSY